MAANKPEKNNQGQKSARINFNVREYARSLAEQGRQAYDDARYCPYGCDDIVVLTAMSPTMTEYACMDCGLVFEIPHRKVKTG